jgi:hypothetical protein
MPKNLPLFHLVDSERRTDDDVVVVIIIIIRVVLYKNPLAYLDLHSLNSYIILKKKEKIVERPGAPFLTFECFSTLYIRE